MSPDDLLHRRHRGARGIRGRVALAGSLAAQRTRATHAGTVPSEGAVFVGIVLATSLLVGALTYFPVLALGPIVEHLALHP